MQTKPVSVKRIFELRLQEKRKWLDICRILGEENGRKPYNSSHIERYFRAYGGANGPLTKPLFSLRGGRSKRDIPKGMLSRMYARTILMKQMHDRGVSYQALSNFFCTDPANVRRRIMRYEAGTLKRVPDKVFLLKTKGLEGDELQAKIVELARIPDYDKTQTIHNKGRVRTLTLGGGYEPEVRPGKKGRINGSTNRSFELV